MAEGRRMQSQHLAGQYTVRSQCQLWYIMASLVSSSWKVSRLIFIWPLGSLQGHQPQCGCPDPPDLSDIDDTNDKSMLCSYHSQIHDLTKGEGDWHGVAHNSCCLWPQSWLCLYYSAWPLSFCPVQGPSQGTSHCSAVTGRLADHEDKSWLWKLNGVDVGGIEGGHPGPLGSMCPSMMALAINCQPSPRFTGLVLSWAGLPTHARAPDNVNVPSLALTKLSPSPNDHCQ